MSFIITQGELLFQSGLVLNGQSYKIFLANRFVAGIGTSTISSILQEWEAKELDEVNGYVPATGAIGSGVFSTNNGRVEVPVITGQFGPATGAGFQFDAMIVKIGTVRTFPYAVRLYDVPQVLAAGQSRGFNITLGTKP
jgi:hypothetical protein